MKAIVILFLSCFLVSCGGSSESQKGDLDFEMVGYFKADNRLRYFTYWVQSDTIINPNAIPDKVLNEIKSHGSSNTNTAGQITASFYYLDKIMVPDITNLNASDANSLAHDQKPFVSVWIMANGQVNLFERPE